MTWLLDTNVLIRLANRSDPSHAAATGAVLELHRRGEALQITSQNLIEFRNVATRSAPMNGLGLSTAEAETLTSGFLTAFPLLADTPDVFPAWKAIVESLGVIGKQVHDARFVAVCHVYGVSHMLTFNCGHFARLATYGPGLSVVDPQNV